MAKLVTKYVCQQCGYESVKWLGRCTGCGGWNTLVEEFVSQRMNRRGTPEGVNSLSTAKAQSIVQIPTQRESRSSTGMEETDRVLGGGIVPGCLVLIGGDPGIGKSTLLLQLSHHLAAQGRRVLYVSGEESAAQLRLRAERLEAMHESLFVVAETDLSVALQVVDQLQPDVMIVDSIQTVYDPQLESAPGSVAQIRECTRGLLGVAKGRNMAVFIVGHVTKEGNLAGPRLLEHMVDTVLYFEGDRHHTYRVLRAVKNRYGSTNELAIFEMKQEGLEEVRNPSELFLSERAVQTSGSAVIAAMEGSRPLLLEVQALVAPTSFGTPKRMATGADPNRVSLILAVLEKRLGLQMQMSDAYVNLAGGVRIDEPAADLGIALALASGFRDRPLSQGDVFIGEIGLTGEVRSVSRLEQRVREAEKLGFERCFVPDRGLREWENRGKIRVVGVQTIANTLQQSLT